MAIKRKYSKRILKRNSKKVRSRKRRRKYNSKKKIKIGGDTFMEKMSELAVNPGKLLDPFKSKGTIEIENKKREERMAGRVELLKVLYGLPLHERREYLAEVKKMKKEEKKRKKKEK